MNIELKSVRSVIGDDWFANTRDNKPLKAIYDLANDLVTLRDAVAQVNDRRLLAEEKLAARVYALETATEARQRAEAVKATEPRWPTFSPGPALPPLFPQRSEAEWELIAKDVMQRIAILESRITAHSAKIEEHRQVAHNQRHDLDAISKRLETVEHLNDRVEEIEDANDDQEARIINLESAAKLQAAGHVPIHPDALRGFIGGQTDFHFAPFSDADLLKELKRRGYDIHRVGLAPPENVG